MDFSLVHNLTIRGVYPYLPMAQLSHDQFLGVLLKKMEI